MTLKKIISFFTLFFVLFTTFTFNVEAATFIQKSARQNSDAVATNDPVTVNKRNSVVLDLSNIIEDLASLKQYIDDNINNMFMVTPTRMENTNRNINIGKQLFVGGNLKATNIDTTEGGLKDNTINSGNIKDGTVKKEDFENGVQFGNEEIWKENGLDIYYNDGNVAIGKDNASEKLEIHDGNLKIVTNGNGIQYPDGTFQTTAFTMPSNIVHLTGDQDVDGNKKFNDTISLNDGNIKINNIKGINDAFVSPDDNSLVTVDAIRHLVNNNKVKAKYGVCGGDNGRRLTHKPTLLCEYGEVQNKDEKVVLLSDGGIAKSCAEIKDTNPKAQSGIYTINPGDGEISVYCNMDIDGGGWTLMVKVDGSKQTFKYDSSLWTNSNTYHPNDFKYDHKEYKSPLFDKLKVKDVMLELETNGERHSIQVSHTAGSLKEIFNGGYIPLSGTTRKDWTNLVPGYRLQPNCNAIGFNVPYGGTKARLGIGANNENNCGSNDSNIGIGLGPRGSYNATAGNNHGQTIEIDSYGYLFVREKKPTIPVEKDCVTLKEKYNLGSGTYKVKPNGQEIEVYCDMETDGGGWMKVLDNAKYGGKYQNTYTVNKNYGNAKQFMAKQRSGYVTCSTGRVNETNINWNRCGGYTTFEIKHNNNFIFSQPAWRKPAPGCQRVSGGNSPIICKRSSSVSINNGTKLTPTWYEPSRNSSTGDNGGDLFIDLYIRDKAPNFKLLNNCREIKEQYHVGSGFYKIKTVVGEKEVYCDMETDGGGWTMIGRGREGWAWNNNGRNTGSVTRIKGEFGDVSSSADRNALIPAYYSQTIVKGIIGNKKMNQLSDGLRLRRSKDIYAQSWQEVRWKYKNANDFSWTFESKYPITMTIDGVSKSVDTNNYTRDTGTGSGNDEDRIFTWNRSGHNRKRGFSYGGRGGIGDAGNGNSSSFLWEYNNRNHAIPYTEVYIRDKAPDMQIQPNIDSSNTTRYKTIVYWECKGDDDSISKCGSEIMGGAGTENVTIKLNSGVREYSNGEQAKTCKEYLDGTMYEYKGDIGNGYYYIKPDSSKPKIKVYCDMTTDGGGYTRYFYSHGNYSNNDALNCFKGSVINSSSLECFNPNRFNLTSTRLFLKRGSNYFRNISNDSTDVKSWSGSGYYCKGNPNYLSVMAGSNEQVRSDYSNVRYVWAGLNYCNYGRSVGGKSFNDSKYMNYSKNGVFGPNPGSRESSNRTTEIYFR